MLPVGVIAFGGSEQQQGPCDICICANDPGSADDVNDKHCCPTVAGMKPSSWDDYCDLMSVDECPTECYKNATDLTTIVLDDGVKLSFRSSAFGFGSQYGYGQTRYNPQRGWGPTQQQSGGAGSVCMGSGCPAGLVCSSSSSVGYGYGVCMPDNKVASGITSGGVYGGSSSVTLPSPAPDITQANMLMGKGIKMLMIDWDMTAHNHHTFAIAPTSVEDLASQVSPEFIALAEAWCSMGQPIAIVTYNDAQNKVYIGGQKMTGPEMIRTVLAEVLSAGCLGGMQIVADNLDRKGQKSQGKQPHIQIARQGAGQSLTDSQILLIDDTVANIKAARSMYWTAQVDPREGMRSYHVNNLQAPSGASSGSQGIYGGPQQGGFQQGGFSQGGFRGPQFG